ncbi:MAG: phosphoribosylglycinamide formyltransferase [Wenzhouxiangellaceae bacterium]|nr:phosphoribosylglycinamide formyltransferase [Wenzhouxiangellaceae bacterium]
MSSVGLVVLISGRGSNALAIIDATVRGVVPAEVRAVIADRPAAGLDAAADLGIDTALVPRDAFPDRGAFERALAEVIEGFAPDLLALAGFMRVLSPDFVARFERRMVNIHPSLLPKFRGLDTHARALAAGDDEHGASVHWVIAELDAGPVIAQARVPVRPGDSPGTLADRVLEQEHRLYPAALALLLRNGVRDAHAPIHGHDDDDIAGDRISSDDIPVLDRDFDDAGRRLGPGPGGNR